MYKSCFRFMDSGNSEEEFWWRAGRLAEPLNSVSCLDLVEVTLSGFW
jgi:hypothetical protein